MSLANKILTVYLRAANTIASQLPAPSVGASKSIPILQELETLPPKTEKLLSTLPSDLLVSDFEKVHFLRSGVPITLRDRTTVAGMTQTGKTTFTRHLTAHYLRAFNGLTTLIFDPKDEGDFDGLKRLGLPFEHIRGAISPDIPYSPGITIWSPKRATHDEYERMFDKILEYPNPILTVLDEIKRLQKRPNTFSWPLSMGTLMREGAGMLHPVITLIQGVTGNTNEVLGQATHIVRFRLQTPHDASIMNWPFERALEAGTLEGKEPANFHGFWHVRVDNLDGAREYPTWQSFF